MYAISFYFASQVGNEERIHVYYAHGHDNPTFVRMCYWLLDKTLENIVLVHYRETKEGSPATPVNSNSCLTNQSTPLLLTEELDSGATNAYYEDPSDSITANHEMTLHEINTLEWDELLATNDTNGSAVPIGDNNSTCFDQWNQTTVNGLSYDYLKDNCVWEQRS
ncbi:hypothetical protein HRI_002969300 [Hibiscus trionum]|uniref:CG-1 domain-containing protein n=1 Tax=Hibiscus trionum TaxID=183268 RepID=A0A9W7IAV0_HIBTR|nr:hypothetical protein HRI_002969300 [Hibiscus trionum]